MSARDDWPRAALIEIVEKLPDWRGDPHVIVPNEIRINGAPVLAPDDCPVIVHELSVRADEPVRVTLTLYARQVIIGMERDLSHKSGAPAPVELERLDAEAYDREGLTDD